MHGATHLTAGIAAGVAVAGGGDWRAVAVAGAVGGLSALLPDWFQFNLPGVNASIKGLAGHRGFSHWLWTGAALAWLLYRVHPGLVWPFLAGYVSHIALDAFSGHGVPALWPWRVHLASIPTGGWMDRLIGGAALVLALALLVS